MRLSHGKIDVIFGDRLPLTHLTSFWPCGARLLNKKNRCSRVMALPIGKLIGTYNTALMRLSSS